MENENRRRILDRLGRTPGLNVNVLGDRLDLARSQAWYHVLRLKDADLVSLKDGVKGNERVCFLPEQEYLWRDPRTRVLFGGEATRNVALVIADTPGVRTADIADRLACKPRSIRHHTPLLEDHHLIRHEQVGRGYEYHPRPALQTWNERVGDGYRRPWQEG